MGAYLTAAAVVVLIFVSGCIDERATTTILPSSISLPADEMRQACFEDGFCVRLEVVREEGELSRGLMFRENISGDYGMLFVFPAPYPYSFWMKNMRFPIDMIWLDDGWTVVHVERDVPPCRQDPCPSYAPKADARYVLEVAANQTIAHAIREGSRIKVAS